LRKVTKLLGPPGTGKTTALMAALEEVISRGVDPARIGFVSFSRKAIDVARGRAANQVPGADLSHFRTIHSTAYHLAGLERSDVLQREHLIEFGELVGIPFTENTDDDLVLWEGTIGNRCLALAGLAAARNTTLRCEWEKARLDDMPWELVARTVGAYEKFKQAHGLWDFNDMIGKAEGQLDIDVLFVDEAQDTSSSQWKLLRGITKNVKEIYLAGDDDQAVYAWSGADPTQLLNFRADSVTLPHSYRLPRSVKAIADKLARRIRVRVPKDFTAREAQGRVSWVSEPDMIDLRKGKWMLLARSNYQLRALRELAQRQGVVYTLPGGDWSWNIPAVRGAQAYEKLRKGQPITPRELKSMYPFLHEKPNVDVKRETYMWQDVFTHDRNVNWMNGLPVMPLRDREYVRALRRNGESLSEEGRVVISTIHGIKGEEADNVVMLTDVSDKVNRASQVDPDAELRVQYVGVTRARESLVLVQPKSQYFWDF
jgi:DNA helicase-2/ATP-dependent DNA helicase PcrA